MERTASKRSKESKVSVGGEVSKKEVDMATRLGVSVRWLIDFTNENKCWDWTTRRVSEDIVGTTKREYANSDRMRISRDGGQIGQTKTFVVHSLDAKWGDLVSAVGQSFPANHRIWIDLFALRHGKNKDEAFSRGIRRRVLERCSIAFVSWSSDPSKGLNARNSALGDLSCLSEILWARQLGKPVFVRAGRACRAEELTSNDRRSTISGSRPFLDYRYAEHSGFSVVVDISRAEFASKDERSVLWASIRASAEANARGEKIVLTTTTRGDEGTDEKRPVVLPKDAVVKSTQKIPNGTVAMNRMISTGINAGLIHAHRSDLLLAACGHFKALRLDRVKSLPATKQDNKEDGAKAASASSTNVRAANLLHAAAESGICAVIDHILRHEDVPVDERNDFGRSPLLVATSFCHAHAVALLLERGANPDARGANGESALMWASSCGYTEIAQEILRDDRAGKPADIHLPDDDGFTAIFGAAGGNHPETLNILLDAGSKINGTNNDGFTPLMYAASLGHTDIVRLLLRRGANPKIQADDGATALIFAATRGFADTIRALVQVSDVDETTSGDDPLSALSTAAYGGHVDAVRALIEGGASLDNPDDDSAMPLMAAASAGYGEVVEVLLKQDPNSVNTKETQARGGRSALIKAADAGHLEVVRTLLKFGADPFAVDRHNRTPLQLARRGGHEDVYKMLLAHVSSADLPRKQSRASGQWSREHAEREEERRRERGRRSGGTHRPPSSQRHSSRMDAGSGGCDAACAGAGCVMM